MSGEALERRPLPQDEPDSRSFWAATRERRLTFQVCRGCSGVVFGPRAHCVHCTGRDLRWRTSNGAGTLYTSTVIRRHSGAFFRGHAPYTLALIDLDEGFRMLSEVVCVPGAAIAGARVHVVWEEHAEVSFPLFELDEEGR